MEFGCVGKGKEIVKRKLADYLHVMHAQDVLLATEEAKMHSRLLLEDQGIIVTYDRHFQDIADQLACLTAGQLLDRLGKE